jgi:LysW-gamma-L-alpha-aminoadipyl-6-phosphate/LysW-L-glutamyl-5-phosphate reductase
VPEIEETLLAAGARDFTLRFVPVSAPLPRGIFVTSFAHIDASVAPERVLEALATCFKGEPFVRVPKKRLPEVIAVAGSNHAEVGMAIGEPVGDRRLITCFSVTDNLIKGGAGQGIQSMNLMLGLDERTTLEDPGSWP